MCNTWLLPKTGTNVVPWIGSVSSKGWTHRQQQQQQQQQNNNSNSNNNIISSINNINSSSNDKENNHLNISLVTFAIRSTAVLFAPALCWLTIVAWQSLQLPQQEGSAGQRIRKILETSLWISALALKGRTWGIWILWYRVWIAQWSLIQFCKVWRGPCRDHQITINYPFWGRELDAKCMVNLKDFPLKDLIVRCLGW